jgi:hypothetical protein
MFRLAGDELVCPVNREKSALKAFIADFDTGKLLWALDIECQQTKYLDQMVRPKLSIDCMTFAIRDWRQLEGQESLFALADIDDEFNYGGGNLYLLTHIDVDQNRIRFVRRAGTIFTIEWTAVTEEGQSVEVRTEVPFIGVEVQKPATAENFLWAKSLLAKSLDLSSLGEPETPHGPAWFRIPPARDA